MVGSELAIFAGAVGLGLLHGAEPGHGWPIAATYALGRSSKWRSGFIASTLLGLGHLVSSLAVVAVFFFARSYFELTRLNDPLSLGGIQIGGPVDVVAGCLLFVLAVREYRGGHHGVTASGGEAEHADENHSDHDQRTGHDHHTDPDYHSHDADDGHEHASSGSHGHDHATPEDLDTKGLWGIVWTAFVLGFAHEEEFEIIGLCLGSALCLELMVAYATAVLLSLVGLTLLLLAGYERYEDRVEDLAVHFPTVSAAILVLLGIGFVLGLF